MFPSPPHINHQKDLKQATIEHPQTKRTKHNDLLTIIFAVN